MKDQKIESKQIKFTEIEAYMKSNQTKQFGFTAWKM